MPMNAKQYAKAAQVLKRLVDERTTLQDLQETMEVVTGFETSVKEYERRKEQLAVQVQDLAAREAAVERKVAEHFAEATAQEEQKIAALVEARQRMVAEDEMIQAQNRATLEATSQAFYLEHREIMRTIAARRKTLRELEDACAAAQRSLSQMNEDAAAAVAEAEKTAAEWQAKIEGLKAEFSALRARLE